MQIGGLQIGEAVRCGQIEVLGGCGEPSLSAARKTATRVTRRVCGRRSTIESRRARRSVCEFSAAAELDQSLAVVEALLIEDRSTRA